MLYALATRDNVGVSVIHDRNPIFVQLADGEIRNGYTVRILNKYNLARRFTLKVEDLPGAIIEVGGVSTSADGDHAIEVGPDQTRELRVLITDHERRSGKETPIAISVTDRETGESARAFDHFRSP
jgi:polyferredoxin